jgi:hypothetical protein
MKRRLQLATKRPALERLVDAGSEKSIAPEMMVGENSFPLNRLADEVPLSSDCFALH